MNKILLELIITAIVIIALILFILYLDRGERREREERVNRLTRESNSSDFALKVAEMLELEQAHRERADAVMEKWRKEHEK